MNKDKQAAAEIQNCTANLENADISLEGAVIILRLESSRFAVKAPATDLSATANDVLFIEETALREQEPLAFAVFHDSRETNAFILTHAHFCGLAAGSGQEIPPVLDDMAQIVGTTAKICRAEDERGLLKLLRKHFACLIDSDNVSKRGAVAVGRSLRQAFAATLVLEKAAQVYLQAKMLGGARPIGPLEAKLMNFGYKVIYSRTGDEVHHRTAADFDRVIPVKEMELREQITALGRQLLQENLVQGTWGNISARLDSSHMLCTPSGLDYFSITPYDIVRVELKSLKYEGSIKPTGEKSFHAALLRAHCDVQCIIHTHPFSGSVFAAAHQPVRPEEESVRRLLCGDTVIAKYGFPSTKRLSRNVAAAIQANRTCIMENHGMLVCGSSIADAHEKCRVTENCARSTLDKLAAGYCEVTRPSGMKREQS